MNVVVIGAQWGDEGKGKIVDFLADEADTIIRFSGGANAGHTIVRDGETYKLHLVPSGIVNPETTVILGSGMVIDPEALFTELGELERVGVVWEGRVLVSDRAHLVLPSYRERDRERDAARAHPIGTTGRGIGIAYAQKALREGVRVADVRWAEHTDHVSPDDRLVLSRYSDRLREMSIDIAAYMHAGDDRGTRALLEGAQGALLDLDLGTYPYVSSGVSCAAGAAMGAGIGPRELDHVLGVFKAYTTRVGNGPFPTEFDADRDRDTIQLIRETGREYGVTTGRPRRIGHLDLVALKYACQVNGIDALALTHLDVYDAFDELRVCIGYETEGGTLDYFPSAVATLERARPVLRTLPGWQTSLGDVRAYEDLPGAAQAYVEFVESYVGVPVSIVSVGYERAQTIVRVSPWTAAR